MKINKNKLIKLTLLFATTSLSLSPYAATTFFRPHDVDFRLGEWKHNNSRIGYLNEYGKTTNGRNWDCNKVNVMQIYNEKESSIGMLLGAPKDSQTDKLAKSLGVSESTITEDDNRGRFIVTGEYEEFSTTFFSKYKLPINLAGIFELDIFVPVKSMKFNNVCWEDQTKDAVSADKEFKEDVSGQLEAKVLELGGLDINASGWKRNGIGDISLLLGWQRDFDQQKQYIKNVRINAHCGVTIPTGEKKDEDQSLFLPFGNDGAWAIPMSLGLDIDFIKSVRAGVNLDLLVSFNTTRIFRMKTSTYQTDFLLLNKGKAAKTQGPTWQFSLYTQAKRIFNKFSATVSYHFLKHDTDRLFPKTYDFDYNIVNTAQSLQEWNTHFFTFRTSYAPWGIDTKSSVKPQISFFYKLPIVTGRRVITAPTWGAQLALSF